MVSKVLYSKLFPKKRKSADSSAPDYANGSSTRNGGKTSNNRSNNTRTVKTPQSEQQPDNPPTKKPLVLKTLSSEVDWGNPKDLPLNSRVSRAADVINAAVERRKNNNKSCNIGDHEDEKSTSDLKSSSARQGELQKQNKKSMHQQGVETTSENSRSGNTHDMDVDMDNAANSLLMLSTKTEPSSSNPISKTDMRSENRNIDRGEASSKDRSNIIAAPFATSALTSLRRHLVDSSHDASGHHGKNVVAGSIPSTNVCFHGQNHVFNDFSSYTGANITASHNLQHNHHHPLSHQSSPQHEQINPYSLSSSSRTNYLKNCDHCSKCKQFSANNNQLLHEAIECIHQRKMERSQRRKDDIKLAERRTAEQGYKEVTSKQIESIITHGAAYGIEIPIPTKLSCPVDMLRKMVHKSTSNKWAKVESRRKQQLLPVNAQAYLDDADNGNPSNTYRDSDRVGHPPKKRIKQILTVDEKIVAMTMDSRDNRKDFSRLDSSCFCANCRSLTDDGSLLEILKKMIVNSYRLDPASRYPNKGYLPIEKKHQEAIIATGASYGVDFPITTKLKHTDDFLRNAAANSNKNKKRHLKFKFKQEVNNKESGQFLGSPIFQTFQANRLIESKAMDNQYHDTSVSSDTQKIVETGATTITETSSSKASGETMNAARSSQNSSHPHTLFLSARPAGSSPFHSKKISQRSCVKQTAESISKATNGDHPSDCDEFDISVRLSDSESVEEELEDGEVFSAQEKHILDKMMKCRE